MVRVVTRPPARAPAHNCRESISCPRSLAPRGACGRLASPRCGLGCSRVPRRDFRGQPGQEHIDEPAEALVAIYRIAECPRLLERGKAVREASQSPQDVNLVLRGEPER